MHHRRSARAPRRRAPPSRQEPEDQDDEPMELCQPEVDAPPPAFTSSNHPQQAPPWAMFRVHANTTLPDLEGYLSQYRPSQTTKAQVSWISIQHDGMMQEAGDDDPATLVLEWQHLTQHGLASVQVLHALAHKYNVLCGKWLVFCQTHRVDFVWATIARCVANGTLGPLAKVSPLSSPRAKEKHVICVYAKNYLNHEDVQRLRNTLRQLGHDEKLVFKPDAFTYCNIYPGNPWGIPPIAFSE